MSLIARLIEAGTPADLIEEVAMMVAEKRASERVLEESRAKARERQAKKRERDESRYVTHCHVTECDNETGALSLPPNENISNPPTHTPPDIYPARVRADHFPRPEWADAAVWADFLQNRKAKRLKNTATAYRGFLADIARHSSDEWPPGRLLEYATMKGWGAIYKPEERTSDRSIKHRVGHDEPQNPYVRSAIARQAERAAAFG